MNDLTKLERRLHCYQVVLWLKTNYHLLTTGCTVEQAQRPTKVKNEAYSNSLSARDVDVDQDDEVTLPKSAVYKAYLNMCREQGLKPQLKPPGLGKMVRNAFPGVMTKRRGPRGRVVQFYVGLQQVGLQSPYEPCLPGCDEVHQPADHDKQYEHANTSEEDYKEAGWSGSGEWAQVSWDPESCSNPQSEQPRTPCDVMPVQKKELWPDFSTTIELFEELAAHCESSRSSFVSSSCYSPLSSPERTEKWRLSGKRHQLHPRFEQLDPPPGHDTAPTTKIERVDAQEEALPPPFVEQDVPDAAYIDEAMLNQLEAQVDGSSPEGESYLPSTEAWARLVICPASPHSALAI